MKKILLLMFIVCLGNSVGAQTPTESAPPPPVTTVQVPDEKVIVDSTKANYPIIKEALFNLNAAKADVTSARGNFDAKVWSKSISKTNATFSSQVWDGQLEKGLRFANSKIYAGWGYNYSAANGLPYGVVPSGRNGMPAKVGISASLLRDFWIDDNRAQLRNAKTGLEKAGADTFFTEIIAVRDGLFAYWNWASALRVYRVYSDLLAVAEKRKDVLNQRVKAGDISEIVAKENLQYVASRKADLAAAKLYLVQASQDLSLFYRNQDSVPIVINLEKYPPIEEAMPKKVEELVSGSGSSVSGAPGAVPDTRHTGVEGILSRPDLYSLQKEIKISETNLSLAKNKWLPKLDVSVDYYANANHHMVFPDTGVFPEHIWVVYLTAEIPVEFNSILGQVRSATATKEALDTRFQFAKETARTEIEKLQEAKVKNFERMTNAKDELVYARELLVAENYKFTKGGSNFFLINIREEALAQAEEKQIQSELAVIQAYLDYGVATTRYQ